MSTTAHLGLTLVEQSQAQKEVTVNTALSTIDAVLNTGAISETTSTPPGSPATGDVYIVAASPTGAWSGQAGNVAYFNGTWQFIIPREGMTLWVNDQDLLYTYNGSSWVTSASGGGGGGGVTGPGSAVDSQIALFNGTSGGIIKAAGGTGYVKVSGGVYATETAIDLSGADATGTLAAGRFPALTGDVTTTAGSLATTIASSAVTTAKINASAVTYAKLQNETADTLLGNPTGSAAAPSEITLGATLAFSSGVLQTAAHTGDVTTSANSFSTSIAGSAVTTAKIASNAVTNAKMATSTANTLAGYDGSGNFSDVAIGSGLALSSGTLSATGGGGGGSVTSVAITMPTEFSVSGSPVTTSGTLAVSKATQNANLVYAGPGSGSAAAPAFRALVGADLPAPGASTLGGVQSITSASHKWVAYINTSGVPQQSQPAFSDISGTATSAQLPSDVAYTDVAQGFSKQQYFSATTLTDGSSIAWDVSGNQVASVTLGGNRTLANPSNMVAGGTYILTVKQDGTGSRTLAYGADYKWPGGTVPTLSTAASAVDILSFVSDGTNMYGVSQLNFS